MKKLYNEKKFWEKVNKMTLEEAESYQKKLSTASVVYLFFSAIIAIGAVVILMLNLPAIFSIVCLVVFLSFCISGLRDLDCGIQLKNELILLKEDLAREARQKIELEQKIQNEVELELELERKKAEIKSKYKVEEEIEIERKKQELKAQQEVYCEYCGALIPPERTTCPHCNAPAKRRTN